MNTCLTVIFLSAFWLPSFQMVAQEGADISQERKPLLNTITNKATQISAHISISLAEVIASDAAETHLKAFRKGQHDGSPTVYLADSEESKELFRGAYYQELSEHLVEEVAKWYGNRIPADRGLFMQGNTFRIFSPKDAILEVLDGIDLADITGTFTYHIRATTNNGIIHFTGVNQISLESYSGENYLRHGLINNPLTGPLSSTTQIYQWQVAIPEKYKK